MYHNHTGNAEAASPAGLVSLAKVQIFFAHYYGLYQVFLYLFFRRLTYRGASEKNVYFYTMYVRKKHNRSLEAALCINVCIHVECAFDAAAGAANGLKAQRAWVRETGTLTLHGEQTDLSL
ncbi:MAG: hypothetical protein MR693_02150 [Bacteroidales bacterium]|nr:hypothetical protein [Bacteroidales bacterium]